MTNKWGTPDLAQLPPVLLAWRLALLALVCISSRRSGCEDFDAADEIERMRIYLDTHPLPQPPWITQTPPN